MLQATDTDVLPIDSLPTDSEEQQIMSEFMTAGCGCCKVNGKPCFEQFIATERATEVQQTPFYSVMTVLCHNAYSVKLHFA